MRSRWLSHRTVQTLVAALLLASFSLPAWSQLRTIPPNAKRATLAGYKNPFVVLGDEVMRLAPGAVIYDVNNRMILPGYLPSQADVVYTTDPTGHVMRIYLLTPHEIRRLDDAKR